MNNNKCPDCGSPLESDDGDCPNCGGPYALPAELNESSDFFRDLFDISKFEKMVDDTVSIYAVPGITPNSDYWPPEQPGSVRVLYDDVFHFYPHLKVNGLPARGALSQCHLRLLQAADKSRAVSLVTELGSNEGQSVTNAAETLATLIVQQFDKDGLTPETTIFFEHYTSSSYRGRGRAENFDLVGFDWHQNMAYEPYWKSSSRTAYEQAVKALSKSESGSGGSSYDAK